jgi:hypothetical protein
MYQKDHLFFIFLYNTPNLLTNKIIVKKKQFFLQFFVFISPLVFFVFLKNCLVFFFFTIILLFYLLKEYKYYRNIKKI